MADIASTMGNMGARAAEAAGKIVGQGAQMAGQFGKTAAEMGQTGLGTMADLAG
nr:unnamed protein product [Callosobruchus analis]